MTRGLIFDFDGVLVDTESAIFHSWQWLFAREGQIITPQDYAPCLGAGYSRWNPADYLEQLTGRRYDWEAETRTRQARLEAELEQMGLMPGAAELLDWCDAQGIPMAVASSSSRRWVQGWLERLDIYPRFRAVFCRTDGYPVKPDPALFLAAQQALELPKEDCLIIEDSENGTLAACNAGIPCVAIPCPLTSLTGDFRRATFRCADLAELQQLLASSPLD